MMHDTASANPARLYGVSIVIQGIPNGAGIARLLHLLHDLRCCGFLQLSRTQVAKNQRLSV